MTNKTATFLKLVNPDSQGKQHLYKLSEPIAFGQGDSQRTKYVVLSALAPRTHTYGVWESETMMFAADKYGKIIDWCDLACMRGTENPLQVLMGAGYEVVL